VVGGDKVALSFDTIRGYLDLRDTYSAKLDAAASKTTAFEQRLDAAMKGAVGSLDKIGGAATRAGLALSIGLSAPIGIAGGIIAKLGIDAAESKNLIETSFGDMTIAADQWAADLSKNLGLNRFETEKTAATLFNMTTSMGLGRDASFEMSTGMVQLAADMASFRNIGFDEALTKIRAGLVGESEPLKAIGILVDENTVKTYAYKNGIAAQGSELTQQQKVLARYGAILQQTSNDQGDLAKTLTSPANQLRIMRSRIEEAATSLGVSLLPIISKAIGLVASFVPYIQTAAEWFGQLPVPVQGTAIAIAAVAAAAGPALIIFGSMAQGVAAIIPLWVAATGGATTSAVATTAAGTAAAAATPLMNGLGVAVGFVGSAVAIGAVAWGSWKFGTWLGEVTGLTDKFEDLFGIMSGLSIAQIDAGRAARVAAEANKEHVATLEEQMKAAGELTDKLMAEAQAQMAAAAATNAAAEADKEATRAKEAHDKAIKEIDTKIQALTIGTKNLTDQQQALIVSYTDLGLSIGEIALKMGLHEVAVQKTQEAHQKLLDKAAENAKKAKEMGDAYRKALEEARIKADEAAAGLDRMADSARRATEAVSFSFEITAGNIEQTAKSFGIDPGWARQMFEQGYSFEEIVAAARSGRKLPPKNGQPKTTQTTPSSINTNITQSSASAAAASTGGSAAAGMQQTNNFYVNGTGEEIVRKVKDAMMRSTKNSRLLPTAS
jgi:hypothetical protein